MLNKRLRIRYINKTPLKLILCLQCRYVDVKKGVLNLKIIFKNLVATDGDTLYYFKQIMKTSALFVSWWVESRIEYRF